MTSPKAERQMRIQKDFGFICDCEACSQNFPTPPTLKYKDEKLLKYAINVNENILKLPPGQARKKFRDCCEIIQKNDRDFPSIELCMLQKCFAMLLMNQAQPTFLFL